MNTRWKWFSRERNTGIYWWSSWVASMCTPSGPLFRENWVERIWRGEIIPGYKAKRQRLPAHLHGHFTWNWVSTDAEAEARLAAMYTHARALSMRHLWVPSIPFYVMTHRWVESSRSDEEGGALLRYPLIVRLFIPRLSVPACPSVVGELRLSRSCSI